MGSTTYRDTVITWFDHASIRLRDDITIYIDPFSDAISEATLEADLIICTHSHFDHFDPDLINKLASEGTIVLAHTSCDIGQLTCEARLMDPGDREQAHGIDVHAVEAYNDHRFRNPGEPFHPQGHGMGVILELDGTGFYHAGDTDMIDEMDGLDAEDIDIAFLPIGGTYTMDVEEAVEAAAAVRPHTIIPIHYNMIEGTEADPERFSRLVQNQTERTVQVLQPEP